MRFARVQWSLILMEPLPYTIPYSFLILERGMDLSLGC